MISNALDVFLLRVGHLRSYINDAKSVEESLTASLRAGAPNVDLLRTTLMYQRTYSDLHYAAKILSLYGFLERYVEDVIIEYVDCLQKHLTKFSHCKIPKYDELIFYTGSKLGTHHKFDSINSMALIDSLQKSIKEETVSLIPDVFYSTSGNYSIKNIDDCFKRLGLEQFMNELWRWEPLNTFLKSKYPDGGFEKEKTTVLYCDIDDIILRRNDIAHGKEITDRLSDTLILERIDFLECLVRAINNQLDNHMLSLLWENMSNKYTPSKLRPNIRVIEMRDVGKVFLKPGLEVLVKWKSFGLERYCYAIIKDIKSERGKQLTQIRSNGAKPRAFSLKLDMSVKDIKEVSFSVET